MECITCGQPVRVCRDCGRIMPPGTHGNILYCVDCRQLRDAEYNRVKQQEHRDALRAKLARLEQLERQHGQTV